MRSYTGWILCLGLGLAAACGDDDDNVGDAGPDAGDAGGNDGGSAGNGGNGGVGGKPAIEGGIDGGMSLDPVMRGDYLVNHVAACPDCHTPRKMDGSPDMAKFLSGVECLADADPTDST